MQITSRICLLTVLFGITACSSSDNESTGAASGPLTVAEFYKARAELGCRRSFACCSSSGDDATIGANNRQGASSPEDCASAPMHQSHVSAQKSVEDSVEEGSIIYHGDKAAACIAALEQITCRELFNDEGQPDPAPCNEMLEGTLPLGETCEFSSQCAGGAGCIGSTSNGYTCKTIPGPHDPCTGYCPYGYYCSDAGSCTEQLPEGSPCDPYAVLECQGLCDYDTETCGPPFEFTPACVG